MLKPDERQHLVELLRPPLGCKLDIAVGTTFSLDLISAMMLPLSFAFFDWERPDGGLVADPLALLEALRRYGDRFTIFCQSGQIKLPSKYPPLIAFLEPCIYDVEPPDKKGVFHPKLWAMRFLQEDQSVRYRVLCLSRNLTFDRCWDTVVALDGNLTERTNAISANHPLGDLIDALPAMTLRPMPPSRREDILKVAGELRRVRFNWPEGFEESECRFWAGGLNGRALSPFGSRKDKALIVSPFVSEHFLSAFLCEETDTHLVSRVESLNDLPREMLQQCSSCRFLAPEACEKSDEAPTEATSEVPDGLHAKLFIIDRGWNTSVFSGSFNATVYAFSHNVEFMVELVGKRSIFGVDTFLRQIKGETTFADLLCDYDANAPGVRVEATEGTLDTLVHAVKLSVTSARPRVLVRPAEELTLFDLSIEWTRAPQWPTGNFRLTVWPITQRPEREQPFEGPVLFTRLSHEGLTPLIAFSVSATVGTTERRHVFVMNLPIEGLPEGRQDRIVRSLIENRDQLFRYIFFLLASGDEHALSPGEWRGLRGPLGGPMNEVRKTPSVLETMLRTLHRAPAQLERVASLLEVLRKQTGSSELLSDDFEKIWEPIWNVARESASK